MQPGSVRIARGSRRGLVHVALAAVTATATLAAAPSVGSAQSLLQSLFGFGSSPRPQHSYPLRSAPHYYSPYNRNPWADAPRPEGGSGGGSFRTVCVRMCDGFYWPISHGVSRSQFTRDARACQSSCGAEARLFYHSTSDSGADGMVDLGGRAYSQIPNAFRYRKSLVAGCACKPAPWSDAELYRHQRYAALEAAAKGEKPTAPNTAIAVVARPAAEPIAVPGAPGTSRATPMVEPAAPGVAPAAPGGPSVVAVTEADAAGVGVMEIQPAPVPRARPVLPAAAQRSALGAPPPTPRPSAKVGPGTPVTVPVKVASKSGSSAGAPVYSHDLGRFVFPGEGRR
jgi:hypothetical protein